MNLKQIVTGGALAVGSMLYTGCSTTKNTHELQGIPEQISLSKLTEYGTQEKAEAQSIDDIAVLSPDQKGVAMQIGEKILLRSIYAPKGKAFADELNLTNSEEVSVAIPELDVQSSGDYNGRNTNLNAALGRMDGVIADYLSKNPLKNIKVITYEVNDDKNGLTSITSLTLNSKIPGYDLTGKRTRYLRGIKEGFTGEYKLTESDEQSTLDLGRKDNVIWLELGIDALGGLGALPYGPAITAVIGATEKGIEETFDTDASYALSQGADFLHIPDGTSDADRVKAYLNNARDTVSKKSTTPEATHYMVVPREKSLTILVATQNDDKGEPVDDAGTYWKMGEDGSALLKLNRKGDTIDLVPAAILYHTTRTKRKNTTTPASGGGLGNGGPQIPVNNILPNGGPQLGN